MRNDNIRDRLKVESITERCRKSILSWAVGHVKEARPRLSRKKDSEMGVESDEDRSRDGWTVSIHTLGPSERRKMKSMTALAGGELCLPQRPNNHMRTAGGRRRSWKLIRSLVFKLIKSYLVKKLLL